MNTGHGQQPGHPDTRQDTESGNPYLRYRTETRTRLVPYSADGRNTELIEESYTVRVPIPPRDWDHIIRQALIVLTITLVAASVAWSTASIGALLALTAPAAVGYLAAVPFDAAWIGCMAAEWLARYDPQRAKAPRNAGHVALAIAMIAVFAHGYLTYGPWVGVIGASVSALAKGMWTMTMRTIARPLDHRTQQWIAQQENRHAATLATSAGKRNILRMEAQHLALETAYRIPDTSRDATPDTDSTDKDTPDTDTVRPETVRSAILATRAAMPDATPEDIVHQLDTFGIDTDKDTVRTVLGPDSTDTDTKDSRSTQRPTVKTTTVRPIRPTISGTVRTAVSVGKVTPDEVIPYVRQVHGQDTSEDTIKRLLNRALREHESA